MITMELKNAEIAEYLGVTRETVRWHIRGLYSKIGVEDREAAMNFGRQLFSDGRSSRKAPRSRELRRRPERKPPSSDGVRLWKTLAP